MTDEVFESEQLSWCSMRQKTGCTPSEAVYARYPVGEKITFMKQNEKKFSCDIASMLFAAGILGCLGLLLWDLESFIHMLPLVFLLGVLMLAVMAFRFVSV